MTKGKLTQNGVHLLDHEWKTVKYFLDREKDIELIPRSEIKDCHMGDFIMDGVLWETKSPVGAGKKNAENKLKEASHQSSNVIVDLRRSKMANNEAVKAYEKEFNKNKSLRRMKIITKDEIILDYRK